MGSFAARRGPADHDRVSYASGYREGRASRAGARSKSGHARTTLDQVMDGFDPFVSRANSLGSP